MHYTKYMLHNIHYTIHVCYVASVPSVTIVTVVVVTNLFKSRENRIRLRHHLNIDRSIGVPFCNAV